MSIDEYMEVHEREVMERDFPDFVEILPDDLSDFYEV